MILLPSSGLLVILLFVSSFRAFSSWMDMNDTVGLILISRWIELLWRFTTWSNSIHSSCLESIKWCYKHISYHQWTPYFESTSMYWTRNSFVWSFFSKHRTQYCFLRFVSRFITSLSLTSRSSYVNCLLLLEEHNELKFEWEPLYLLVSVLSKDDRERFDGDSCSSVL